MSLDKKDLRFISLLLGTMLSVEETDDEHMERAEEVLDKVNEELKLIRDGERNRDEYLHYEKNCPKCGWHLIERPLGSITYYICPRCQPERIEWP